MLDVGGESTRPGAARVGAPEQIGRVVPAIRAIRARLGAGIAITVDTTLAAVAAAALDAGADGINDVSAGTEDEGMFALAAGRKCGIVLMHRLRTPGEDSYSDRYAQPPVYGDVVAEVRSHLGARMDAAMAAGVSRESIALDPGLGFGKTVEQNLALVRGTPALLALGRPIVSGVSRKSFSARAAGIQGESRPTDRLAGTLGLSVAHAAAGAAVLRVHDVLAHVSAVRSLIQCGPGRRQRARPSMGRLP
jgi:dihydropteroate synthase